MFRVGQKVVLVGWAEFPAQYWESQGAIFPRVGDIYTIRAIHPWRDSAVLLLQEIDNSHIAHRIIGNVEPGFAQSYFRPIVSRPTSIKFAHEILRKATRTDEVSA